MTATATRLAVASQVWVHRRGRALVAPMVVAAGACAAATTVALVDPSEPGHYPTCPVLALTGHYCTGCGTLRAVHSLLRLNPAGAWDMNPLAVLMVPVVLGYWSAWVYRSWTGVPRGWLAPPWVLYLFLAVVVVFTVARNIPMFEPWLAP